MAFYFKNKGTGDVGEFLEYDDVTVYYCESWDYPQTYFSLFGKVKLRRVGYCHRGQPALFPLDAQMLTLAFGLWMKSAFNNIDSFVKTPDSRKCPRFEGSRLL